MTVAYTKYNKHLFAFKQVFTIGITSNMLVPKQQ
jgi:hypothetical protein